MGCFGHGICGSLVVLATELGLCVVLGMTERGYGRYWPQVGLVMFGVCAGYRRVKAGVVNEFGRSMISMVLDWHRFAATSGVACCCGWCGLWVVSEKGRMAHGWCWYE